MVSYPVPMRTSPMKAVALASEAANPLKSDMYLVYGGARHFEGGGAFGLSIKTARSGGILYRVEGCDHRVLPDSYLVVNEGQQYTCEIQSPYSVTAYSLFFSRKAVVDAVRSLRAHDDVLRDLAHGIDYQNLFYDKLYFDQPMIERLKFLQKSIESGAGEPLWLQQQAVSILQQMFKVHEQTLKSVESLSLARSSTRDEVYRRIHKARDYALAHLDQPVTLDEMANVACFSTSYLMRTFKYVFNTTPYQYIAEQRLERAKKLLANTDMKVGDIGVAVGFTSFGAFSWFFSRRAGLPPQKYRQKARAEAKVKYLTVKRP